MTNNINKKGVSLITLTIAIIIMLILAGIVTYMGRDIIISTKSTAFAEDINTIYEATQEYYAVNGSLPVTHLNITASEYLGNINTLLGNEAKVNLSEELRKNEDENSTFYEVDIEKLGIESLQYGSKEDEKDIFLISIVSQEIYYYKGFEIDGQMYFSSINIIEKN